MKSKMNKAILAAGFLVAGVVSVNAQTVNKFGSNPMTISSNAVLELESSTKGLLAPRMTLVQRNAMTLTAASDAGMLIFQTDATTTTNAAVAGTIIEPTGFYQWSGTRWVNLTNATNAVAGNIRVGVAYTPSGGTAYVASQEMTLAGDGVAIDPLLKTVTISANGAAVSTFAATNSTLTAANNAVYTSGIMTLSLPTATSSTGRTFLINKTDNALLTFSIAISDMSGGTFTTTNIPRSFRIQSNGTNWYILN